jgi:HlyD family secretion protein
MTVKRKFLLIGAGVVVVGGFTALSVAKRRQPSVEVRLEKVQKRDLVSIVTASGRVQPKRKVDVSSDITGRIVSLPVREGDMVERNQVLVRIDPTQYEASVQSRQAFLASSQAQASQARATKDQADRAFVRARDIRAQNPQLVSQEALEQAETQQRIAVANLEGAQHQVEQSAAALREAQDALRKTTIVAPMSGKVTRLAVEEGEVAVPGTFSRETGLLMTISDLSVIEVTVQVDETDVIRLQLGDSAEVSIDAYPDTTFTGRVTEVANSSVRGAAAAAAAGGQEQAVDYEVVITLDRPPRDVRPDLSATARVVTATRVGVLTVPIIALTVREPEADSVARRDTSAARRDTSRAALRAQQPAAPAAGAARDTTARRRGKEIEGVFVVDTIAKTVRFRPVKVGITGDEYFEVVSGVREGETIVSGSYQAIRDLKTGGRVRQARATGPDSTAARRTGT